MATRFHELKIAGCTRQLPILNLSDTQAIAAFVMLGDVELVENCAKALLPKVPKETEIIMTAETKGIPLAASLSRLLGFNWYITARKSVKAYMEHPLGVEDESITTLGSQKLYIMDEDMKRIKGKKVLLLDDVISRGGSMKALRKLAEAAGGIVIGEAAAVAEGAAAQRTDIIFLASMPLFDAQ
ncbi:MAG: adenine phosphoribosyltransferase [Schwartzia sp.]|nr:adenine phosphoribosyltransferase [Schwartzia sp. (in: firmicutes)]MBR5163185.1 adenine phosphoribosyltransferase [Schwartzia sp. (in: firmicutes)]